MSERGQSFPGPVFHRLTRRGVQPFQIELVFDRGFRKVFRDPFDPVVFLIVLDPFFRDFHERDDALGGQMIDGRHEKKTAGEKHQRFLRIGGIFAGASIGEEMLWVAVSI